VSPFADSYSDCFIIKDTDVLNEDTIMKVQMPNRDGFIDLYPGNL
jgi:hypothetical protein